MQRFQNLIPPSLLKYGSQRILTLLLLLEQLNNKKQEDRLGIKEIIFIQATLLIITLIIQTKPYNCRVLNHYTS